MTEENPHEYTAEELRVFYQRYRDSLKPYIEPVEPVDLPYPYFQKVSVLKYEPIEYSINTIEEKRSVK